MEGSIKGLKKEHSHKSSSTDEQAPARMSGRSYTHPSCVESSVTKEHTRHKIKRADYPAVLPYSRSRELFASSGHAGLPPEERTVRGTFVQGLNDHDIHLLDLFEGDEYTRENVEVHALGPLTSLSSTPVPTGKSSISSSSAAVPLDAPSLPPLDAPSAPLPAETYIYAGPLTDLSPELWSYEDFVRENAWKWVGRRAHEDNYIEVDRRRDLDGKTLRTEIIHAASVPGCIAGSERWGQQN